MSPNLSTDRVERWERLSSEIRTLARQGADVIEMSIDESGADETSTSRVDELVADFGVFQETVAQSVPLDSVQVFPPLLCISTQDPATGRALLGAGADILRPSFPFPEAAALAIFAEAALICQPEGLSFQNADHRDPGSLRAVFAQQIDLLRHSGLLAERLILNLPWDGLISGSPHLTESLRRPILLDLTAAESTPAVIAQLVFATIRGCGMFRVNQVAAAAQAVKAAWAFCS